jgi:hypothetical protein
VRRVAALLLPALVACASDPPPPAPPGPALVSVEVLRGFAAPSYPPPAPRVVALVDASKAMAARDAAGITRWSAARAGALRWLGALPETTEVELWAVGGARDAACATPPRSLGKDVDLAREALLAELDRLSPAGEGSLAEAIFSLADSLPRDATRVRVVAFGALADGCGGSLCDAARELSERGARLDLVVLGEATAPPCLADLELADDLFEPPPARPPVPFRVERADDEPAVMACSEAGGLPVALPAGRARIRVALDPPLVVEQEVELGTRSVLEVVDFPALELGERQWRWRSVEAAPVPVADVP